MLKRTLPIVAGIALSIGAFAPTANAQFVSDEIVRQAVTPIDVMPGIDGAFIYEERGKRTDFVVAIDGLPAGAYTVTVGGQFRGFLSSFRNPRNELGSEAELVFSTRQRGDRLLLSFEPRGELIEIRSVLDDNRLYASGRLPFAVELSENEDPTFNRGTRVRETFEIIDGSFADGRLDIKTSNRKALMNFRVKGLVPGVYQLTADGMEIGSIVAEGRGKGAIRFSTDPRGSQSELAFDPTGVMYELMRIDPGVPAPLPVMQGMIGNAQDVGGGLLPVGMANGEFTNSGFDKDASGELKFDNSNERAELLIDLAGLPEGMYSVQVEVPFMGLLFFEEIATVNVIDPTPEPEPEPEDEGDGGMEGEGEGGEGEEGEEMPEEPMLPQGVGPDNDGAPTFGSVLLATDGLTAEGEGVDANGNRVVQLEFDDQGLRVRILDAEGRTYLIGRFPDSSFAINQEILPMMMMAR